ncbi:heme-binding protein [bacterium]|nr:MAG: heme-binding protein [bacterium]
MIIIGFALVLVPPLAKGSGTEGPVYSVVKKDGDVEIRDYEGYITAQVNVSSDYNMALYSGFMELFNYISGKNTNRSKISMTAPVTQEKKPVSVKIPMTAPVTSEKVTNNEYTISFVMPAEYTLETLPIPEDKNITFNKIEPHRAAVISFSGRMDEALANKKIAELRGWLGKNNMKPKSNFIMAQYNPPWIPGFMRKNEIMVDIWPD